ncbi:hypothetical protein F5884DRAFT_285110 [Xylogone sp. PMI_703]|nr:hypothetical protein F5884DRAFT_285110 [Xylogone sp. PMI_703]
MNAYGKHAVKICKTAERSIESEITKSYVEANPKKIKIKIYTALATGPYLFISREDHCPPTLRLALIQQQSPLFSHTLRPRLNRETAPAPSGMSDSFSSWGKFFALDSITERHIRRCSTTCTRLLRTLLDGLGQGTCREAGVLPQYSEFQYCVRVDRRGPNSLGLTCLSLSIEAHQTSTVQFTRNSSCKSTQTCNKTLIRASF